MSSPCVITINKDIGEESIPMNVDTGDVPYIEILEALKVISKHFAQEVLKHAESKVGPNHKAQEEYIDRMIAKRRKK